MKIKIGVIGLGYVGLPLAVAFARKFPGTVGYDISALRVKQLKAGTDSTGEMASSELQGAPLTITSDKEDLKSCNFFVVGVPTPVDENHNPDLRALTGACENLGPLLKKGDIVVFESTVYPGVTEDICGPILEKLSGLKSGKEFFLAYSPERINPGDKEHTLERIVKVVSGQTPDTLEAVSLVYGAIITAGIHRAPSIKVAEAAKVIENTQRDLNIALMNELAIIFDRMGISTSDVLAAAGTKWNFLKFSPGLVGGHCIGVDPYYLTTKAEQLGYHPQVILAGRRINDDMGKFIAQRTVKLMINVGLPPRGARVGILGITFKENVSDIRNSRVPDIITELKEFGILPVVHDPLADSHETEKEYGIKLSTLDDVLGMDAVILAVPHRMYLSLEGAVLFAGVREGGIFIDVKSVIDRRTVPKNITYWSL